jgi:hypothetical protein
METFSSTFFSIFWPEKLGGNSYIPLPLGSDMAERKQGYTKPLARSVHVAMKQSVGGFLFVP